MQRRNIIRSKADIDRSYHNRTRGLPMLNVKVWVDRDDILRAARAYGGELAEPLFLNWLAEIATDEQLEAADQWARELGWEQATNGALELFGPHVKVWGAGRSGGWLVVEGLADPDTWNAIALGKWRTFAKWVDATVADHAYRIADGLRFNEFDASPYAEVAAIG